MVIITRILVVLFLTTVTVRAQVTISNDSLKKLLALHPQKDTIRVKLLSQLAFGSYYNNPVLALQTGFEARALSDSLGFQKGQAEAYRQIGLAHWAQGDLNTAMTYYLLGLGIAQTHGARQEEADLVANIGLAYNGLGDYREALTMLRKARQLQINLKNEWREAAVLNNMGDAFLAIKQYDSAIICYQAALEKSRNQKYVLGVATNTRNIGNVYEAQLNFDLAEAKYFEAMALAASIQDNRGFILSNKSLASLNVKKKKFDQAERYALTALEAAQKAKLRLFMRDAYEVLYRIHELRGNATTSFRYFKLYVATKDSVQSIKTLSEVNAQRFRFETEKKTNEITLLKKEAELQNAHVTLRNNQLIFTIFLLLASSVAVVFVIKNYRKEKVKNQLLKEKNIQIEAGRREISEHLDELAALNEELISQQEELSFKNQEIEKMNARVMELNSNLEKIVEKRTEQLEKQNLQLTEYAFFNAHQLRAPVASILGLLEVLAKETSESEKIVLMKHLHTATENLDQVILSVSAKLEEGLRASKHHE